MSGTGTTPHHGVVDELLPVFAFVSPAAPTELCDGLDGVVSPTFGFVPLPATVVADAGTTLVVAAVLGSVLPGVFVSLPHADNAHSPTIRGRAMRRNFTMRRCPVPVRIDQMIAARPG